MAELEAARDRRIELLRTRAGGALLVRPSRVEGIDEDAYALASDRARLRSAGVTLPCAVLDLEGDGCAKAMKLGLSVISGERSDWIADVQSWLGARQSEVT